jgi:alpha-L-fucosidase
VLKSKLPELPTHEVKGLKMLAPAERFADKKNVENPELYAVFPFRLVSFEKPNVNLGVAALDHRWDRGHFGWRQDDLFMAYLGLADQVREAVVKRAGNKHAGSRFPVFWGPNYDWVPDQDHGGVLLRAFQTMLMQTEGKKIHLFPAWPGEWNVDFKLHAPYRTTVSGSFRNGEVLNLMVVPESRKGDVIIHRTGAVRKRGVPTPEQIAWHGMELQMFVCLDPCTWQGREYDNHSTPLSEINPARLDTDQWCEAARLFGARQILFVAKHTGGFCWWQTDTSEYSIKNTPHKGGKGDILAELSESCRKYGLKLAVYIYPGDDQWGAGIGSGGRTEDPAKQEAYNQVLRRQWTEVLSRYGRISEIWFDGSCVIELGDIIDEYAPNTMIFQGPHATLRWVGNERGIAPYPMWQTVKREDAVTGVATDRHSDPDGDVWLPMEVDTTLLDHKWFWGPGTDHMMKSLDHLMDIYYKSVGRGAVLLLNSTPDITGRIPTSHVKRYEEFGKAIRRIYENKKGETSGRGTVIELTFDRPTAVNHVITMEDIRFGQIVRAYEVDGLIDGQWQSLVAGQSIGYKRIDVIDTVVAEALRLRVVQSVDTPVIKSFAAYEVVQ